MLQSGSVLSAIKHDHLLADAIWLVWSEGKASTSFVQRRLSIGYNRAAGFMEAMQALGVVSRPNHVGKREVSDIAKIEAALCVHPQFAPLVAKMREAPARGQEPAPALSRGAWCKSLPRPRAVGAGARGLNPPRPIS